MMPDPNDAIRAAVDGAQEHESASESPEDSDADHKDDKKPTQRDRLLMVVDDATFWKCHDGTAHVSIRAGDHIEHHPVRSRAFRDWLVGAAAERFLTFINGRPRPWSCGKSAIEDALSHCEARAAISGGNVHEARLRVAAHESDILINLGDPTWRAAHIAQGAWRIVDQSTVPILRSRRTGALPEPMPGGSVDLLRPFVNASSESDFRLIVLWLLAALRPTGPYPILALSGEQGSGKSILTTLLRRLVDPVGGNIMQPPMNDRDLIAAARNNPVLAFDNLSGLSRDLSDSLARLATGGDIGGRKLFSDDDSAQFSAKRPIILNGIPDLAERGDLASRAIVIQLEPLARRRTEADFWESFDAVSGQILGALFDALAAAMAILPTRQLPDDASDLRMADFALLAMAAETALGWPQGSALGALRSNVGRGAEIAAENDPVAAAIRGLIEQDGGFAGTTTKLWDRLAATAPEETRRGRDWPSSTKALGARLRRLAPVLRHLGVDIRSRHTRDGMTHEIRIAHAASVDDDATRAPFRQLRQQSVTSVTGDAIPLMAPDLVGDGSVTDVTTVTDRAVRSVTAEMASLQTVAAVCDDDDGFPDDLSGKAVGLPAGAVATL